MAQALSEWGLAGMAALRDRVAALVVVDVLSFSTAVDIAVSRGAWIYPFPYDQPDQGAAEAARLGAVPAGKRSDGGYSLSPTSLLAVPPGLRLMLPSPNGSALSLAGGAVPVLAGCLRNAAAVAEAARRIAGGGDIGVVPAGERWPDGSLRPAIEDLLGAGAVLHHLDLPCSPEAEVARDAYRAAGSALARLIRDSVTGRELIGAGFAADVDLAVELAVSNTAPLLMEGAYRAG
jgi:2-phosphosulfolactate phosphatase